MTVKAQSTTGRVGEFRLSDDAKGIVFQMLTDGIYSNPIGSIVREIASNCFDSHAEAGVNTPVIVKRSYDETSDTHYISFIDYGVGMSPERVENVYGVYLESTKRETNDQIGGFGIGGKTPLAYKRTSTNDKGEKVVDTSFFVITNFDGTQYYYTVFLGEESPQYVLLDSKPTDERNGTEIRIPVLRKDWDKFETEIVRQLYYFENIIFEGFESDKITNEYKIFRGENFLYRGNEVYSRMHVCLGKVAYPINFEDLGLNGYDYDLPVAVNVPIGAIGVTPSRESIKYSEQTIKYLKDRIDEVVEELKGMLSEKYDNVRTLKDYFNAKQNFGKLELVEGYFINLKGLIKPSEIDYTNYSYNAIPTPSSDSLFNFFFNVNIYGKKELKGWRSRSKDFEYIQRDYDKLGNTSNVLYHDNADFPRKRIVQAYLKQQYGRFYVVTKKNSINFTDHAISNTFNVDLTEMKMTKDDFLTIVMQMQEEYFDIVRNTAKAGNYDDVEVPEEFLESRKQKRVTEEMKKLTIPMNFIGGSTRQRIKLEHLFNFNETIFYGTTDDEHKLSEAYRTFSELFPNVATVESWSSWRDGGWSYGYRHNDGNKKKIMFIRLAKNNVQYMKYCRNAYHVDQFYVKMLHRKIDLIKKYFENKDLLTSVEKIGEFYQSDLFKEINPRWGKMVSDVMEHHATIKDLNKYSNLQYQSHKLKKYIDIDSIKPSKEAIRIEKKIDQIVRLQEKNAEILNYINMPYRYDRLSDERKKIIIDILTKVMDFR
jgi:hypothetical protein